MNENATVSFAGVSFSQDNSSQLLSWLVSQAANESCFKYLVTPNADHIVRLQNDVEFQKAYIAAEKVICDSRVIGLICRLTRRPVPHIFPGSDLVQQLIEGSLVREVSIVGGTTETIEVLKAKFPELIIQHYNPPMNFISNEAEVGKCLRFLKGKSGMHFLALGSPQQEMLAARLYKTRGVSGVAICCGAAIEYLAGTKRRAPMWMRKLNLEWLYRMLLEPRRLGSRYLKDAFGLMRILARS